MVVPHGTEQNPAGRSQPASIGDHWLCPWYSAPISSSSACIVASRRSRTNDLTAYLGCREDGSVYTPTPAIDLILRADDDFIGIAIHGDKALGFLNLLPQIVDGHGLCIH